MQTISEHTKGLLFVLTAALLWSTGGLFIKLISFSAMQLSFFRCAIAAITFALIFKKRILLLNRLSIMNSIIYAVVLISFVIATKTTTAANAIFLPVPISLALECMRLCITKILFLNRLLPI